jgi:hypothetical protein
MWTCVLVFIATSIITLLAVINKLKINKIFLNKLFIALILEIVVVSVYTFKSALDTKEKKTKLHPSPDVWFAVNKSSGEVLKSIRLLQGADSCDFPLSNSTNLDLTLRIDAQHQISIDNGVVLGKLSPKDVLAFYTNSSNYAKTSPLAPEEVHTFDPKYILKPFSMTFGFCIKSPGILFFRIYNKDGKEAKYEQKDGNLICLKQTKAFFLDEQKYFISCIDYDTQLGTSQFVVGIL